MRTNIYNLLNTDVEEFLRQFVAAIISDKKIEDSEETLPFVLSVIRTFGMNEEKELRMQTTAEECRKIRMMPAFMRLCLENKIQFPRTKEEALATVTDMEDNNINAASLLWYVKSPAVKIKAVTYCIHTLNRMTGLHAVYSAWSWKEA